MRTVRMVVSLEASEMEALVRMAHSECRQPKEQARQLIRQAAQERGLISAAVRESGRQEREYDLAS